MGFSTLTFLSLSSPPQKKNRPIRLDIQLVVKNCVDSNHKIANISNYLNCHE